MTSNDHKINELYDRLKSFNNFTVDNREELKKSKLVRLGERNIKFSENYKFESYKLGAEIYLKELLGYNKTVLLLSGIKNPIKCISNPTKIDELEKLWTNNCYHIIFINESIRLKINEDQVHNEFFGIFKNMLDKTNNKFSLDNGLNIHFYSDVTNELMLGPFVYITNIDTKSILLNVSIDNSDNSKTIQKSLFDIINENLWYY
jgi:hypothetical protein